MKLSYAGAVLIGLVTSTGCSGLFGDGDGNDGNGGRVVGGAAGTAGAGGSGGGTGGVSGSGPGGAGPTDCVEVTEISASGPFEILHAVSGVGSVAAAPADGLGDTNNLLMLEFYQFGGPQQAGEYDLAVPPSDNYSTCDNCIRVLVDVRDEGPATQYFQVGGGLTLTSPDAAGDGRSSGRLVDVTLVEVSVDGGSYFSSPLGSGRCVHIEELVWDLTAASGG